MTSFQKGLLVLLSILVFSISYYLLSNSKLVEVDKLGASEPIISGSQSDLEIPEEYHIRIVHVGGIGVIDWQTELVDPLSGDGRDLYLDQSKYRLGERSPSYMNKAKDIIWLNCKSGYSRKNCRSDSDTEVWLQDDGSCGIQIDKMKIFGRLECIKSS